MVRVHVICLQVGPQAVFVVTRDDDDISSAHTSDLEDGEDDNDGDDAASWETVDSSDERDREAGVSNALGFPFSCTWAKPSGHSAYLLLGFTVLHLLLSCGSTCKCDSFLSIA